MVELEEFQWATLLLFFLQNPLRGCRMKVFFWGGAFHQGFTTALPGVFGSFQRVVCMRVMCGWVELMPRRASQGEKQWPKKHGRWYITHLYRDSVSLSPWLYLEKKLGRMMWSVPPKHVVGSCGMGRPGIPATLCMWQLLGGKKN